MDLVVIVVVVVAVFGGVAMGWVLGNRPVARFRSEREERIRELQQALAAHAAAEERARHLSSVQEQLEAMRRDCSDAQRECARLSSTQEEKERAFETRLQELKDARDLMSAQFS